MDGRITQILIFFSWDTSAGQFGPSFRGSFPPPQKKSKSKSKSKNNKASAVVSRYKIVQVIVKKARSSFKPFPSIGDADEVFVYGALASMLVKQKGFQNLFRGELFRKSPLCLPIDPTRAHFPGATSLLLHMGILGFGLLLTVSQLHAAQQHDVLYLVPIPIGR